DAELPCSLHQRARVGDCLAAVNDEWPAQFTRQFDVRLECGQLLVAWRMIVMVVEAALSDRDRVAIHGIANGLSVAGGIEGVSVVRMNARGKPDEAIGFVRDHASSLRGRDRF